MPDAEDVHVEGEDVFIYYGDDRPVIRYRLSAEAKRAALLAREGRPKDIAVGPVDLLPPASPWPPTQ